MKKTYFKPALLAMAALVSACGSLPTTTSLLDQTRSDYQAAENNPNVASYASLEMKQAQEALELANTAAKKNESTENIDKLAYIAKQKIALTQEKAKQKLAESAVASSAKERDQMRLDQRTNEADLANRSAEQAKYAAKLAQGDTAEAQRRMRDAEEHAQQLEAQLADLAAKKTARGMVITLNDVLFGTDLARLTTDGVRTVQKLAVVLQQNPQRSVLIEGFADSTGTAAHNQELSERRAAAVADTLQELGIARNRIAIKGYGESYPIAANDSKDNRQLNRRVEIILSDGEGRISQR